MSDEPPNQAVRSRSTQISKLFPASELWADEDEKTFQDLRSALIFDLSPQSPYQCALAEDLVNLEWEKHRHRRMRNALLKSKLTELAAKALSGEVGVFLPGPSSEDRETAKNLFSSNPEIRADAEEAIVERGTSVSELLAQAYQSLMTAMSHHEARLTELETRRRRLMNDYQVLCSDQAVLVEDAEDG